MNRVEHINQVIDIFSKAGFNVTTFGQDLETECKFVLDGKFLLPATLVNNVLRLSKSHGTNAELLGVFDIAVNSVPSPQFILHFVGVAESRQLYFVKTTPSPLYLVGYGKKPDGSRYPVFGGKEAGTKIRMFTNREKAQQVCKEFSTEMLQLVVVSYI